MVSVKYQKFLTLVFIITLLFLSFFLWEKLISIIPEKDDLSLIPFSRGDDKTINCPTKTEEKIVKGGSLSGILKDSQTVKILYGYYKCHEIQRGDVVLYNFAGSRDPLIKIVKAIPGDSFNLVALDSRLRGNDNTLDSRLRGNDRIIDSRLRGNDRTRGNDKNGDDRSWNILINGKVAKNSLGQNYTFNEKGYQMLSLYEKDYRSIVPIGAYLILGNLAGGSLDSSRFGLVGKEDILGKAEW